MCCIYAIAIDDDDGLGIFGIISLLLLNLTSSKYFLKCYFLGEDDF